MVDKKLIAESATPTPSEVRLRQSSSPLPLLGMGKEIVASSTVVNPPGPPWKDRTSPDSDRFRDRNKPSKDKLPDIIRNNPIFGDKGKVKVPIDGGYEPRWRPGRDGKGGAGGGGPKPGEDPEDLTYIELTYEEFLKLFFEGLNLPFMLKKMLAQTEVVSFKRRGITNHGPKARLNKMESAKARLKRAVVMKNAHPEEFIENFEGQCQAVFEAYLYHAAILSGVEPFVGEPDYSVLDDVDFCNQVAFIAGLADQSREDEFRAAVLLAADLYRKTAGEGRVPYKLNEIVQQHIEEYVRETVRNNGKIPMVDEVPFHKSDMRFGRIEERKEPDSKAVAFLILDRSGSMDGDPLAIAKAFFLLNILFLRAKYKNVEIVMIAHDAHAERIADEKKFYKIAAGGGTVAVPAWKMTLDIAEAEYPPSAWNRYMFHATDGMLFDGDAAIISWWTKIVESPFNYCGYLEVVAGAWGGDPNSWQEGGRALLRLKKSIAKHVGMSRVSSLADLPRAFAEILDKDRVKT